MSLASCVFVPPPPLPEELAAEPPEGTVPAQSTASPTAEVASTDPTSPTPETGEAGESSAPRFEKGKPPPVGLSASEIIAYNAAQGDPRPEGIPFDEALAGISGEGALWARFHTVRGPIDCRLLEDRTPLTVANFVALARGIRPVLNRDTDTWAPKRWYDGSVFHRVIPGFMIQGGDPTGTGLGNPGYVLTDEFAPDLNHDRAGVLSMANRGPGTGSAQFFITLAPTPHLDGRHTVFGECDPPSVGIADDIALVPRSAEDKPDEPETIDGVEIYRSGAPRDRSSVPTSG
ncbi:MAG: peptidylprolyl isomerase [Myxococcales bacterium FL481]|nr:MAG: peptidylprolyl isomerase [Myxococcales bacterium FL481]